MEEWHLNPPVEPMGGFGNLHDNMGCFIGFAIPGMISYYDSIPIKYKLWVSGVIVNSKLLKRHSKAKRRAPAYSPALRQIRGVFQRIVRGRLRSVFQRVRECVKSEVFSKE